MSWKDYLYFQKGDRVAILLLCILIVLSGGVFLIIRETTVVGDPKSIASTAVDFEKFQSELKDEEGTDGLASNSNYLSDNSDKQTVQYYSRQEKLKVGQSIELNSADTSELKKIPGIGTGYSNRIVKYRNLLGGYVSKEQLKEVWGVDEELYNKIIPYIVIEPKSTLLKVNSANFKQLNKHPYINYKQANIIVDIRGRKGKIESFDRLLLLDEFSDKDIERLKNYISFD